MSLKKLTIVVAAAGLVLAGCATHKTAPAAAAPTPAEAPAPAPAPTPAPTTQAVDNSAELKAKADADAAAAAAKQAMEATLAARTVHFGFDSSDLQSTELDLLKAHAKFLASHADAKVQVEGNCDERGTAEYNLALGERRAKSVASFLESEGVSASQIKTVSFGKEKPVDPGHDESAWAKNRRADLNYLAGQP